MDQCWFRGCRRLTNDDLLRLPIFGRIPFRRSQRRISECWAVLEYEIAEIYVFPGRNLNYSRSSFEFGPKPNPVPPVRDTDKRDNALAIRKNGPRPYGAFGPKFCNPNMVANGPTVGVDESPEDTDWAGWLRRINLAERCAERKRSANGGKGLKSGGHQGQC